MNTKYSLSILCLLAGLVFGTVVEAADPVVSNVRVSQRPGTKLVDILYDVADADGGPLTITLEVSDNSGTNYAVPSVSCTGDLGANVTTGLNKQIVWNAGADWNQRFTNTMYFKVTASDVIPVPPLGMAFIPSGTFTMGDSSGDGMADAPTHSVTLSPFYMDKYPVTKALWDAVAALATSQGYSFSAGSGLGKGTNHPVYNVSWYDVVKWCNAQSQQEGKIPVYYTDAAYTTIYKTGDLDPYANWNASGYRLPTEAEWEYAARGGLVGKRFLWGDTITHSQANYISDANDSYDVSPTRGYHPTYNDGTMPYTSPVGAFAQNGYGLYDMAGNVFQWCWDWYGGTYYQSSPGSNPHGSVSGSGRVVRGGSWGDSAFLCRVAYRFSRWPDYEVNSLGFRSVLPPSFLASTPSAEYGILTVDTRDSVWQPQIAAQPQGQTVPTGGSFILQVTAQGLEPFAYQWRKDGTNLMDGGRISGTTTNLLNITNCTFSDAGNYSVVVTNNYGAITSQVAVAAVYSPYVSSTTTGSGTVTNSPNQAQYTNGQSVALIATPARWYQFVRWSDGVTANPRTITIGATNNYTAVFTNSVPLEQWFSKQWERTYGGSGYNQLDAAQNTPDGGFILGGMSNSGMDGNKGVANYGGYDYWVIKIDASGNKQWERGFGGMADDILWSIVVTSDGSYVLAGYSSSGADGNKTTANWGQSDVWLIKLDANGNKVWEREYGGSGSDYMEWNSMIQTSDGGFLVGASSDSPVSGNKAKPNVGGGTDWWILKLDPDGNKQWEAIFGTDSGNYPIYLSEFNGGYLITGTASGSGGNKTSPEIYHGDGWVIKIDLAGNKTADYCYGTWLSDFLFDGTALADGGYWFVGQVYTVFDRSILDAWLLRIDASGNALVNKFLGGHGIGVSFIIGITTLPGNSYLAAGGSTLNAQGDKTSPSFGGSDGWVFKFDESGNKTEEWTFGGTGEDCFYRVLPTGNSGVLLAGSSASGATGNKTTPNYGSCDFWLVKMAATEMPVGTPKILLNGQCTTVTNLVYTETNAVQLTLQTTFADGMVWYTLDGSTPTTNSLRYTGPFVVANTNAFSATTILRALAYNGDRTQSALADPLSIRFIARPIYCTVQGGGTIAKSPEQSSYTTNQVVTLTAIPGRWYQFVRWSDGVTASNRAITIGATNNYTAVFTNTVPLEWVAVKQWERVYGGTADDVFLSAAPTIDGGYILGGYSASGVSGNRTTGNFGGIDYWVVKVDANGVKQWETNYGGTLQDSIVCVQQTSNGGYILNGYSYSGASGNKTSVNFGQQDAWLLKLDANGVKLWETNYGGTDFDGFYSLQQTIDGGYMLSGYSRSGVSGNKTSENFGDDDGWLLKLDANGVKLWETNYGGTGSDGFNNVQQTSDGGYLMGGWSRSGVSGNKTTPGFGLNDYWVVKVDANGVKLWETAYGGTGHDDFYNLTLTSDGGCILVGNTYSGVSGNKTSGNYGDSDCWVVKLDANGVKQWETNYGGLSRDQVWSVQQTRDGGYLLGGDSSSGISGNKTSDNFGNLDVWALKLDANGGKQWDQSFGGTDLDSVGYYPMQLTRDGGFILAGYSGSGVSGNKTSGNFGLMDGWVIKMASFEQPVGTPQITFNGLLTPPPSLAYNATNPITLEITTSFPGGSIYYSLDGSEPGIEYPGPGLIVISNSVIIRATAYNADYSAWADADPVIITAYPLAATVAGSGSVVVDPPSGPYLSNAVVSVTALPNAGWFFSYWTGDASGTNASVNITMNQAKNVRAVFTPSFSLAATTSGGGTVAVNPTPGPYLSNTVVTVTATPAANWVFLNWTGDASGANASLNVTMDRAKSIQAVFGTTLSTTVVPAASGSVTVYPNAAYHPYGQPVRLTGVPNTGNYFKQWGNAAVGNTVSPLDFIVTNAAPSVTAVFAALPANYYALNVLIGGEGRVTRNPQASNYLSGATVSLSATPAAGHAFSGWSGDATGSNNPLAVVMSASKTVTANFTNMMPQIVLQPQSQTVDEGSNVTFTVTAIGGAPLSYQWLHNGVPLGAPASSRLDLVNVQFVSEGWYVVVVSNDYGSVTSSPPSFLSVNREYTFITLAGLAGSAGSADGTGSAARFGAPNYIAVDIVGNLYIAEYWNHTIRKVSAAGVVTTLAGLAGSPGSADGTGSEARFYRPYSVAVDSAGSVYVADSGNYTIRKISAAGAVTTLAGSAGSSGSVDGIGSAARFGAPNYIAVDIVGNLYIADYWNHTIRKVSAAGVVTTLAGLAGSPGSADGTGSEARFNGLYGMALDITGNIYVADEETIRKVTEAGLVTTLAGLAGSYGTADGQGIAARFSTLNDVAVDCAGNVYVADYGNHTIRKMTAVGMVTTLAGLAGSPGSADGTGSEARFKSPTSVAVDTTGNLYVADGSNHTIRKGVPACADRPVIDQAQGMVGAIRQLDTAPQTAVAWQWSILQRPAGSQAQLSATNIRNPVFTPDVADLYIFELRATNATGAIAIRTLEFTAVTAPAIVSQSQSLTVVSGTDAALTVTATGTAPLSYQWFFNGAALANATNSTFSLQPSASSNSGNYTVVIANNAGSVTSQVAVVTVSLAPGLEPVREWTRIWGTAAADGGYSVVADKAGNVYVAGDTSGALDGQTNFGGSDAFLTKYMANGVKVWTRQWGSAANDGVHPFALMAVDSDGNIYVANHTLISGDNWDAVLTKFAPDGTRLWSQIWGSSAHDFPLGLALDNSNQVYVVGYTWGAFDGQPGNYGWDKSFLSKFASDGTRLWSRIWSPGPENAAGGVVLDPAGNIYVTGEINGPIEGQPYAGGWDYYLNKFSPDGTLQWTRMGGSSAHDGATGVGMDSVGRLYVYGCTDGALEGQTPTGGYDLFLVQYLPDGSKGWTRQWGSTSLDQSGVVKVDIADNIYVGGYSEGAFDGQTNCGGGDLFLTLFASDGTRKWTRFLGSSAEEYGTAIDVGSNGAIYQAGYTAGAFDGQTNAGGGRDAFLTKWTVNTLNTPLGISTQPTNQVLIAGTNATLNVVVEGAPPLSYQWWFNGTNRLTDGGRITGTTSNLLTLSNLAAGDAGNYTVIITNAYGSVTSQVAVMTVSNPVTAPAITQQPAGVVVAVGGQVNLSAGASGTGTLAYQWRKNGTNLVDGGRISGATSTNLTINNATVADSGSYQVVVSNAGGSVSSDAVPVVVGANVALAANGGRLESFTSQYAPAWGAALLIDGLNGDNHSWCSPAYPGPQEFVLSFSNHWNAALGGIVVQNYGEDAYYSRGFELLLSPDNNNWTLALSGQLSNTVAPQLFALTNSSARYVKLRVTSGYRSDYWELGEVAVHGAMIPDYPPTISDVANQTIAQNTVLGPLAVTVSDPETSASALALTGRSENTALVPNANIVVGGSGSNRTVTITPAAGQAGTAAITLTVSDGFNTASDSFVLTVQPPNQAPTVAITSPAEGNIFGAGADITVAAQASDVDGTISQVQFYAGITFLGVATNAPYSVIWSNVAAGSYALTARAVDNQGATTTANTVNITVLNNQTINITVVGSGSVSKAPEKAAYVIGESVTLTASPARWYQFSQWGDGGTANPRSIVVAGGNNYTAIFTPVMALETNTFNGVTRVAPSGMPSIFVNGAFMPGGSTNIGSSAQISMQTTWANATLLYTLDGSDPTLFSPQYSSPLTVTTSVVVKAMAWNNSTTPVTDAVQVNIIPVYALSVNAPGGGAVSISPPTGPYLSNSVITATATPSNGWSFVNWSGDLAGSNTSAQLVMNSAKSIQAIFGTTINPNPNSSGLIVLDPPAGPYPFGSKVSLMAVPNAGFGFAFWSAAVAGTTSPLRFTVTNANPALSAVFGALGASQYSLTPMINGKGSVALNLAKNVFNSGEVVTLTAAPDTGWSFVNWSGDATGQSNVLVLTMNGNKTVTANFMFGSVPQTITFAALPDKTFGDAPITLIASASSGLQVSFAVVSGPSSLNGNLLTLTGAGTVLVRATQAGNNDYAAATPVERSFTVAKAAQTINFTAIADKTLGVAPFALSASASSSLAVAYRVVSGPATLAGNMVTLTGGGLVQIEAAQAGDVNYLAAVSVTNSFTVNVTPSIIRMTTNLVAVTGSNAVFWVEAGGTAPLSYQWQIQNNLQWLDLAGETGTNYLISRVNQQNGGCYRVVVRNACGTVNSEAMILLVVDPPQIVAQPLSQSVPQGSYVELSVTAGGTAPIAYQWRLNATNIFGATTTLMKLYNVQSTNSGDYTVVVTNAGGSVTSAVARVLVSGPPTIVSQPQGTNVVEGAEASFSVQATGIEPLTYQWNFNGVPISGQDQASLVLSNLLAVNAGDYQVLVSNPYGSLFSEVASLVVATAGTNTTTQVRSEYWVTDGRVAALAEANGALYIGGEFATVWPHTGSGAVLDPVSGAVNTGFPDINGEVDAVASDGAGGWFIGGNFTVVGGLPRQRLAHLLAGKQVDPDWAPSVNAPVLAMALSEGKLYIGGSFTNVNGQMRNRLAALNTLNGAPDTWHPDVDGPVYALAVAGSTLYAGGQFGLVKGQARQNVAALPKLGSGEPVPSWNPGASHTVLALAVGADGTLYLGGQFQSVAGQSRKYLAALNAEGILQAWNPGPNNRVFALAVSGTTVYAGGDFTMVGSASRGYLAGLAADAVNGGAATSWSPVLNNTVFALAVGGGNVYVGGQFSTANSQGRSKLAAYDTVTGSLRPWNPNANGTVKVLAVASGAVYAGGQFNIMGPQPRSKLAAMDLQTGQLLPWNPAANGNVWSLAMCGTNLIAGGDFTWVGGRERHFVAGLDLGTGLASTWDPSADGPVRALAARDNLVYAGGAFQTIGSQARRYVASLELNSNVARAEWNPGVDNLVLALAVSGSTVYLGGDFGVVSGTNRSCLAAVDAVTGVLKGWDPMANDRVQTLSCVGSNVYAGGDFTQIGGQARTNVAALDGTTGAVRSWNAGLQGQEVGGRGSVASVREENGLVYVGGGFNRLGGQTRQNLGVVSASSGGATSWRADVNGPVSALSVSGGAVYVGGQFSQVGEYNRPNLAVIVPKGPPSLIGQPLSQTVVAGLDSSVTLRVIAGGQSPLYYQWSFKGTNIAGATNSTLTFNGVYTTNAGTYQVVVSNLLGVITSGSAYLTVNAMPTITSQLTNIIVSQYSDVAFTASAAGSPPFSYQWRLNGVNIPNATNATYTITNAVATNSGSYSYAVQNNYGSVNSDPFVLIVDPGYFGMSDRFADRPWTNSAYGSIRCYNTNATHEAYEPLSHVKNGTKYGNQSVWLAWRAPATGMARFSTRGSGFDTLLGVYTGTTMTTLTNVVCDEDGGGFLTSAASFNAVQDCEYQIVVDGLGRAKGHIILKWEMELATDDVPEIDEDVVAQTTAKLGQKVMLKVKARNRRGTEEGLRYQWYCRSQPVPQGTNSTLTIDNVQLGDIGNYVVEVYTQYKRIASSPAHVEIWGGNQSLTDLPNTEDKLFDVVKTLSGGQASPQGLSRRRKANTATPGLETTGSQLLSNFGATKEMYEPNHAGEIGGSSRWFTITPEQDGLLWLDTAGSAVPVVLAVYEGSEISSLSLKGSDNNPENGVAGLWFPATAATNYLVAVDAKNGANGKINLNWLMGSLPGITNTLVDQAMWQGGTVSLSVGATGYPTPTLQWLFNGQPLSGETGSTLTLNNVTVEMTGKYSVQMSNVFGVLPSLEVQVTVTNAAPLVSHWTRNADTLTLLGRGFDLQLANNQVWFGAVRAAVLSGNSTQLVVRIPLGAAYGPVSVANPYGRTYSAQLYLPVYASGALDQNSYNLAVPVSAGSGVSQTLLGDIDGDGLPDLVVLDQASSTISVYQNTSANGVTVYTNRFDVATPSGPVAAALGDLDGDGRLDLAVVSQTAEVVSVYRNVGGSWGANLFSERVGLSAGARPSCVALGDLDGDGRLDIAVGNMYDSSISLWRNQSVAGLMSPASFATRLDLPSPGWPVGVAIGDMDGDGRLDLVTVDGFYEYVTVYRNEGLGANWGVNGVSRTLGWAGPQPAAVGLGDVDGDGRLDVIVANEGNNTVSVLRNTSSSGAVSIAARVEYSVGSKPRGLVLGDMDGDGKLDVLVACDNGANGGVVSVLRNAGLSQVTPGSFAAALNYAVSAGVRSVVMGDVNGDNLPELGVGTGTGVVLLQQQRASQTITFGALGDRLLGEAPLALGATASSGLPVSYAVVSGPATLNGNVLTLTGGGVVVIEAQQGGDGHYLAALPVRRSFTVRLALAASATTGGTVTGVGGGTVANLIWPANGGRLESFTSQYAQAWGAAMLTDGGKTGAGASWCSPVNPGPQSFVWSFANQQVAQMEEMVVYNYGEGASGLYCRAFTAYTSLDGQNWTPQLSGEMLSQEGPQRFSLGGATGCYVKLVITSGYQSDYWELSEVEVMGRFVYDTGASVTVNATANSGYRFVSWTENGNVVSSSASYTFAAETNRNLVANFVAVYAVGVSAQPTAGGTATGGGIYDSGASVTVTATPNTGYRFVNWTESSAEVSTAANLVFTVATNRTLLANFASAVVTSNLIAAVSGGSLASFTAEYHASWGASKLTDGGKGGAGASWCGPANPGPQLFVWSLGGMGQLDELVVYNFGEGTYYCRGFAVSSSTNGQTWTPQYNGELLAQEGPQRFSLGGVLAQYVKLTITSGYRSDYWELGEVEVMGRLTPENLALPAKGGKLESFTAEYHASWGAAKLTDGGPSGTGASWASPANPGPQSFVWSFGPARTAQLEGVAVYNYGEGVGGLYSRGFTVQTSLDGQNWTPQMSGELLAQEGAQRFSFGPVLAQFLKLTITSGYRSDYWELGEVEVLGKLLPENLLAAGQGGKLESFTAEYHASWGAAKLTDGGKGGAGASWCGPANPGPQLFVWSLGGMGQMTEVVVYNFGEGAYYCRGFTVQTSTDGQSWTQQLSGELLAQEGPQLFSLGGVTSRFLKLTITSGYRSDYWELGEVEVLGKLQTENLIASSQGGKLESFTAEYHPTWGAAKLTDGVKLGAEVSWASPANPEPQAFVWSFANLARIEQVVLYNYGEGSSGLYSRGFTVQTSLDGQSWTPQLTGELLAQEEAQLFRVGAVGRYLKLTITSGYRSDYWELGEVEVLGQAVAGSENLLLPAKGGKLESFTAEYHSTWGAAMLTDGGKAGAGASWCSLANPGPQSFVWSFAQQRLAQLDELVIYNYGEGTVYYSRGFTVYTSLDNQTWTSQVSGELQAQEGPQRFSLGGVTGRYMKLVITSGYQSDYWELGEVELMGILK